MSYQRTLGAVVDGKWTRFKVWAPSVQRVDLVLGDKGRALSMVRSPDGFHTTTVENAPPGTLYRYRLNNEIELPDPCSLFQPSGPLGPSMVVDHNAYRWRDARWKGITREKQVLYEMHIGTFTREGTFRAAARCLKRLQWLGITCIEVMPVSEAEGRWGWGYDGVDFFAPLHHYGDYDDFKAFVDHAHSLGLGVVLDVVYNHFGPSGNFLSVYSPVFFTRRHKTDWGEAINFYGHKEAPQVRRFFIENAAYWIADFHLDGLRFDATQNIYDESSVHILAEITEECRRAAAGRSIVLIAENNEQDVQLLKPVEFEGQGMDAVWADDFHHAVRVAITGLREAYTSVYHGSPQELISAAKQGYLYQGQHSPWIKRALGKPVGGLPGSAFIFYLQNHDQVANSLKGERVHSLVRPDHYRALAALWLLAPETPLFFMGQEYGAKTPFLYFTDQEAGLADSIRNGRREFLSQFPSIKSRIKETPDPLSRSSFLRCKLDYPSSVTPMLRLHKDLIDLRRSIPNLERGSIDGAVLGPHTLLLRYGGLDVEVRLIIVNTGETFEADYVSEPLAAPAADRRWRIVWRSDARRYGGREGKLTFGERWLIPPWTAVVFKMT